MTVEADDEPLPVAAARAGDPAAWDALFHHHQLPLYAYARELLLARHAEARPRLDEIRAAVLGELREVEVVIPSQSLGTTLWQQLVIACRPAWVAFGAVWGVILLLNTTSSTVRERPAVAVGSRRSPEVEAILTAQRQLWVELAAPSNPLPPRAKKSPSSPPGAMRPREQRDGLKTLA